MHKMQRSFFDILLWINQIMFVQNLRHCERSLRSAAVSITEREIASPRKASGFAKT